MTVTPDARESARIDIAAIPGAATTYTVQRTSPSGSTVSVRGAQDADVEGAAAIVHDWEVPFDVALHYVATFYDDNGVVLGTASADYTHSYGECEAWVVDLARPTNSLPLTIESFVSLDFEVAAGVMRVLNRRAPVLVTLPAWTPEGELVLLTETLDERDALRALLGEGYPILVRTIPEQGVGNIYLGVTDFKEERLLSLGDRPQRRFTIAVVQVERPAAHVFQPIPPATYAAVAAEFANYADLLAQVHTYDQLAYWWDVGGVSSGTLPWLPSDV
jgi:hypothetical protein